MQNKKKRILIISSADPLKGPGLLALDMLIDPCGQIVKSTPWWEEAVLQGQVQLLDGESFFVRYGDMTGRVAVFLFLLLGAAAIVRRFKK